MTTNNHWGTFKGSVAVWHIELPAALWARWADVVAFADRVLELGQREDVFRVGEVPSPLVRERSLFGESAPAARVAVFGPTAIEERAVRDLGAELVALRPELANVPRGPALAVAGPQFLDRTGPVYISISIDTDIWFPRVVGIHDDGDQDWYDNAPLAARHTPRLNRFLAGVRSAAAGLGGTWEVDVGNARYEEQATEDGIVLPPVGITVERVAAWAEGICTAPTTSAAEIVPALGIPGTLATRFDTLYVEPTLHGTIEIQSIERGGVFARLDMQLADPTLTHADLEGRFGPGRGGPRVNADSYYGLTFQVAVPGAPYGCAVFADFTTEPAGKTLVSGLSLRRQPK